MIADLYNVVFSIFLWTFCLQMMLFICSPLTEQTIWRSYVGAWRRTALVAAHLLPLP